MKKKFRIVLAALFAAMLVPALALSNVTEAVGAGAAGEKSSVVDGDTTNNWTFDAANVDTMNLGRIWTDKTVKQGDGTSDFLTTLSAISSASNTSTTVNKPLDIVMVLDVSGSMDDSFGGGSSEKKLAALKTAANSFLDTIANENAKVTDTDKKHKVSLVKFAGNSTNNVGNDTYREFFNTYNYSQIVNNLTLCEGSEKDTLSSSINGLIAGGATQADEGLNHAQRALADSSAREDAKKIVVFFTDGEPTRSSSFENAVASSAIAKAKELKDAKVEIFSVGIFSDANPAADPTASSTSNTNKFMHAVSSNYPTAQYTQSGAFSSYVWNFGTRADQSNYYMAANDAEALKKVFDNIASTISEGSGYPTQIDDGFDPETGGYIAFEDELGSYMKVDGFKTINFGGTTFSNPTKTTVGNVDKYVFEGSVDTPIYPKGNLNKIVITVTKSEDMVQGDKVQVKVPASLIPVRYFNINNSTSEMSVTDAHPIQITYASSLKDGVIDSMTNPDAALAAYMAENSDGEGNVEFLANAWSGDQYLGDVTSTFYPAKGNTYYYITEDTPIYSDDACTVRAQGKLDAGKSYYYKRAYCAMVDGKKVERVRIVEFPGSVAEALAGAVAQDASGNSYFVKGTARHTYLDELYTAKTTNVTETATDVLKPGWKEASVAAASTVVNNLGNNGKLKVEKPGTLSVSKTVAVQDGYSLDDYKDKNFTFKISIPDIATEQGQSFPAEVKNANGDIVGEAFELAFDATGKATHTLKHGETLYVYELPNKAAYAVTEEAAAGFETTSEGDTGKIVAGEAVAAAFTNTYSAEGILDGKTNLAGSKVLSGRDWNETDAFVFMLVGANPEDAPLPESSTVKLENLDGTQSGTGVAFNFGDITFVKPGTYVYSIYEDKDASTLNKGVSESKAVYQVTVTVSDAGDGTLSIQSKMEQRRDDAGNSMSDQPSVNTALFTNLFRADEENWSPRGVKHYVDTTGGSKPITEDMFYFRMTPVGDAPGNESIKTTDGISPITFDAAQFTQDNIGKTYTYKVNEVIKVDGVWKNVSELAPAGEDYVKDGMTYDASEGTVSVKVTLDEDVIVLEPTYSKNGQATTEDKFEFLNHYASAPVDYDTAQAGFHKVITGRDWDESCIFKFDLDKVSFDGYTDEESLAKMPDAAGDNPVTVTSTKAKENEPVAFDFGKLNFTQTGTYVYKVTEQAATAGNEFEYDAHESFLTVKVTDNGLGNLVAEANVTDGTFTNDYVKDLNYSTAGDFNVTKVLTGRNMTQGQFQFVFTPDSASKDKFSFTTNSVPVNATDDGETATMTSTLKQLRGGQDLVFTRADAGKTYKFTVYELPTSIAGYECDTTEWDVSIAISVENGKVKATTTVEGKGESTSWVYTAGEQAAASAFVSFANSYAAKGAVTIKAEKELSGRALKDGEFEFSLCYEDGESVFDNTFSNDEFGSIFFGELNYDIVQLNKLVDEQRATYEVDNNGNKTWTVKYAAKEKTDNLPAGVTAEKDTVSFIVTVVDKGNGTLEATAAVDQGGFVFLNRYTSDPVEYDTATAGFSKVIKGADWVESDEFTFDLAKVSFNGDTTAEALAKMPDADGTNPAKVKSSTAKENDPVAFNFGKFRFTEAGTYIYKVTERSEAGGFVYDTHEATLTIDVVDNDEGKLIATATVAGATFTNTFTNDLNYTAVGDMEVVKVLRGRDMMKDQFTFEFWTNDDDSAKKLGFKKNTITSLAAKDGQSVTMSGILKELRGGEDLIFSRAEVDKKYKFYIKEKNDGAAGYKYDGREWTVRIDVGYEIDKVKVTTTVSSSAGDPPTTWVYISGEQATSVVSTSFSNQYSASGSVQIKAAKELSGRGIEAEEFEFSLHYEDETAVSGQIVKNDASGNVDFGNINYDVKSLNDLVNKQRATYTVDDKGNRTWTIKYIAKEDTSSLPGGVSSTKDAIPFTVTAVDNGDGTLKVTADAGTDGFVFKNVYSTGDPIPMALNGIKALEFDEGLQPADITGKFTFTITSDDKNAPMPKDAQGNPLTQVTNDKNGVVDFGNITFSLEDLNKALGNTASISGDDAALAEDVASDNNKNADAGDAAEALVNDVENGEASSDEGTEEAAKEGASSNGLVKVALADEVKSGKVRTHTFTYKITETGTVAGVTNDAVNPKTVQFKVTDDGEGHLTVERITPGDVAFTFKNSYSVDPTDSSVSDQLTFTKILEGRAQNAGEFTYKLYEDNDVVATGTNGADGSVTFTPINYTKPGEHTYYALEDKAGKTEDGVTYGRGMFGINTNVTDNGDGTLKVTHQFVDKIDSAKFINSYAADPVTVQLAAGKELTGATLADGQFTFSLMDESNKEVATAKNNAAGQVTFDAVRFAKVGTYVYTITEKNDGQAGVTYDDATHKVTVKVTDDLKGHLVADVAYDNGAAPVFKNKFTPTPKKPSALGFTGDNLGLLIGIAFAASVAAGTAAIVMRKSKEASEKITRRRH